MYIHISITHFGLPFVGYTCSLQIQLQAHIFTKKNPLAVIRCYNREHVSLLSTKHAPENKTPI